MGASREELESQTLLHAARNIPYYTRHAARHGTPRVLDELPVVDADLINRDFREFCDHSRWPDGWLTTGGTTGKRTLLPRAFSERAYSRARASHKLSSPVSGTPLQLQLIDSNHGIVESSLDGAPLLALPFVDSGHAEHIRQILTEGFAWNGSTRPVRVVIGSVSKLKALTNYLAAADASARPRGIGLVLAYAWHLSSVAADAMASFWNAPIQQAYGLTEANCELAHRCRACGGYHYREAVLAEFLDPRTRTPTPSGDAELCVTTLYPFMQVSPRVRYATRDIVRPGPVCSAMGARSFEFLGRTRHTLLLNEGDACRVVLAARAVADALDTLPWVARFDRHSAAIHGDPNVAARAAGAPPLVPPGFPKFGLRIDSEQRRAWICVEAAAESGPVDVESLRAAIVDAHLYICPDLAQLLRSGRVTLVCEAGPAGELARRGLTTEPV